MISISTPTFRFSWNVDTAQCSVIDSEPLTDLSHASNANAANAAAAAAAGGVWHPAKNVAAAMKVQTFYAFSTIFYSSFFLHSSE